MADKEDKSKKEIVVATSGYFDPIHPGHIRLFEEAKKLGDKLVVIINGDGTAIRKKGFVFMHDEDRAEIIKALKPVDEVLIWDDGKTTYIHGALEKIKPDIFAKGGDRPDPSRLPKEEVEVCEKYGIKMVFNVGGDKIASSSELLGNYANKGQSPTQADDIKVYFSGPLYGNRVETANIKQMVEYVKSTGVEVLNEHIGEEDFSLYEFNKTGSNVEGLPAAQMEKIDIDWLDEATHFIAEVSGASTGVGREVEYARLKGKIGKRPTKVLCLYNKAREQQTSIMIRGMDTERYLNVSVRAYSDIEEAKRIIDEFLNLKKS